jgi:hypothetical protein
MPVVRIPGAYKRVIPVLLILAAVGCRARVPGYPRDLYAGIGLSAVPGVGLFAGGGKVFRRHELYDWSVEAQFFRHLLDDKDILDDERGGHGRVSAVRAGFKHATNPGHKRRVTYRYGLQFHRATGTPGVVDDPGDYYGLYASVGFETDLSRRWTMGPEFSVALLEGEGRLPFEIVPTFFWHLIHNF